MLTSLSINDIVLIAALDLDFGPGLSVLTGETGAGKSILLDALGLVLGDRADSALVRQGTDQGQVTASFDVPPDHPARALLADADLDVAPDEPLLLRRRVRADGGSKAFINDLPVSATLLRAVGDYLVEIHGQHDDRGLLQARGHRALLDAFTRAPVAPVEQAWRDWAAARDALDSAEATLARDAEDRAWLDHVVAELAAFGLIADEEQALADERATLQRVANMGDDFAQVLANFTSADGALAQLRTAARRLERLGDVHPLLTEALAALDRAIDAASESENCLIRAEGALRADPERLDAVETRLFDLRALARKHKVAPDDLPALLTSYQARQTALDDGTQGLEALRKAVATTRASYVAAAASLRTARAAAAAQLDGRVATELAPLKLDAATFATQITPLDEERWGPHGTEAVEFLIATNPGAPLAPLMKIASGGELSRFILALKVALAEQGGAATMIFDEIDRGVGGAVASAIGDRLARLADGKQVLVVTHSPQVAARGATHLLIAKQQQDAMTRTDVAPLDRAARREEIARMLSGADITDEARAQADKLLGSSILK